MRFYCKYFQKIQPLIFIELLEKINNFTHHFLSFAKLNFDFN